MERPDSAGLSSQSWQHSFAGMLAPVSGWGWTDEVKNGIWRHFTKLNYFYTVALFCIRTQGGRRSNTLQKVDVPILANKECQQWYKDEKKSLVIVDTAMCAGLENGGNDSCQVFRFFIVTNLEKALRKCLRCNKHICLNWQGDWRHINDKERRPSPFRWRRQRRYWLRHTSLARSLHAF